MSINIARGLCCSFKNARSIEKDVESYAKQFNNCYEVLNDCNRVFLDIDKHVDPLMPQENYDIENNTLKEHIFALYKNDKIAVATASSFAHRKISYHVHFVERYCDKQTNKAFAKQEQPKFENATVDSGVYGANQKIRMVYSSKDGENRPMTLILGTFADTLISHIPEGCVRLVVADPKEVAKKEREQTKKEREEQREQTKKEREQKTEQIKQERESEKRNAELMQYIQHLTTERLADYQSWITLGLILKHSGISVDEWDCISQKAENYTRGKCQEKWETFTSSDCEAGIPTILGWIEEDSPEIFGKMYPQMKIEFEKMHFKIMNPPQYVRLHVNEDRTKTIQFNCDIALSYANLFTLDKKLFISQWTRDENIRCYESINFYPNPEKCPKDQYNTYNGFDVCNIEPTAADISKIIHQIRCLVAHNEEHFQYLIRFIAHIFQCPDKKALIYLVFNGVQGTGKDSFWEFIGKLLGRELFLANARVEEDLCGRFNLISSRRLLIQCQEVSREVAKKYKDKIKSLITQDIGMYEDKGIKQVSMKSYERYIFTTNDDIPMFLEHGERRSCIFTPSEENKPDTQYWDELGACYENAAIQRAFYDYLMGIDLKGWDIRKRPITDTYKEVAIVSSPPLAKFFGECIADGDGVEYSWTPATLCDILNTRLRQTTVSRISIGRELMPYIKSGCIKIPKSHKVAMKYTLDNVAVKAYLQMKGWWYDERGEGADPAPL